MAREQARVRFTMPAVQGSRSLAAPLFAPKVHKRREGRSKQGVLCWALILLGIGLGKRRWCRPLAVPARSV